MSPTCSRMLDPANWSLNRQLPCLMGLAGIHELGVPRARRFYRSASRAGNAKYEKYAACKVVIKPSNPISERTVKIIKKKA